MKIGFVLLAHENLFRVRQIVRHLSEGGSPVALHLDSKVSAASREMLEYNFSDLPNVYFVESEHCEWGHWSIVEATIRATQLLLKKAPGLDFIANLSGSCLPIRPLSELKSYLETHKYPTDFIESHSVNETTWVTDGLSKERTTLYHFFNWKSSRKRFNFSVGLQRLLGVRRKAPDGLDICHGSQWWCLSTRTLKKILNDPSFEKYCRFFRSTWIPDESFFQTLARKYSPRVQNVSLTYANFDHLGKPFIFYDDHINLLKRLDRFFVRKVWTGADQLYSHFLNPYSRTQNTESSAEEILNEQLSQARAKATLGRKGIISQFRIPKSKRKLETANPYTIYVGLEAFEHSIRNHFNGRSDHIVHGNLYHRNRVETTLETEKEHLREKSSHLMRNYEPVQFLSQLIWNASPQKISFFAKTQHLLEIRHSLAYDANCKLVLVQGAWLLHLSQRKLQNLGRLKALCKIEMLRESQLIESFNNKDSKGSLHIFSIGEVLKSPEKLELALEMPVHDQDIHANITQLLSFAQFLETNSVDLSEFNLEALHLNGADHHPNVIKLESYKKNAS